MKNKPDFIHAGADLQSVLMMNNSRNHKCYRGFVCLAVHEYNAAVSPTAREEYSGLPEGGGYNWFMWFIIVFF